MPFLIRCVCVTPTDTLTCVKPMPPHLLSGRGHLSFLREVKKNMPPLPVPCIECGHLTRNGSRCVDCSRVNKRREDKHRSMESSTKRGYNSAWRRLSARARAKQPFCLDCGSTDNLTADHSPQAWERVEAGLPLRLQDIDVVCQACNNLRGAARGEASTRSS